MGQSEVKEVKPEARGPLAALLVEDSPLDAELLARHLQHSGYHLTHRRVENGEEFRGALREKWDVVLCDYQLPDFGVERALAILKEMSLDVPFIVVSGAAGEETAVEVMRSGAHDYILKYRLARLVPAIERERREAVARRERAAALHKLTCLAAIVDSSSEAVIGQDSEGMIATWNAGAERLFGYSTTEVMGKSIFMIFPADRRPELAALMGAVMRGESAAPLEVQAIRRDDGRVDIALTISPIKNAEGKVVGISLMAYNVTERKQLEEERKQMIEQLNETLSHVKTLSGLLPICASCKKVRDDHGYWQKLETFLHEHSRTEFSHSICPECMETLYPQFVHSKTHEPVKPSTPGGMEL